MFVIKHRSRRRIRRSLNHGDHFFIVGREGFATESVEEAVDVMIDAWRDQVQQAPQAPTLADIYG